MEDQSHLEKKYFIDEYCYCLVTEVSLHLSLRATIGSVAIS